MVTPLCVSGRIGLPKRFTVLRSSFCVEEILKLFFLLNRSQEFRLVLHPNHLSADRAVIDELIDAFDENKS